MFSSLKSSGTLLGTLPLKCGRNHSNCSVIELYRTQSNLIEPVSINTDCRLCPGPPSRSQNLQRRLFLNFKISDSAPFSQKTYHKDMTLLSRRSRQLLCHQCNCFPLRLQMLPVKGEISPEESLLLLMS